MASVNLSGRPTARVGRKRKVPLRARSTFVRKHRRPIAKGVLRYHAFPQEGLVAD